VAGYCVGVTGGVASGKSAVTQRFAQLGVFVADADLAAREAVEKGSDGLAELVAAFGPSMLTPDGALDRAAMRRHIFGDEGARRRLEAIVHPRVRALLQQQCDEAPGAYALVAIPLLAEGGRANYPWLQRVLVVDATSETQLARLMQRDGIDSALAQQMIAAQATRQQRLAIADDVLSNDGALDALDAGINSLDTLYRALASGR